MKIEYTKSAEKDILSLDRTIARRIYSKIANLEDDPFGQGARKLEGEVIEDYPKHHYGPACLVYGKTVEGKVLHIVCSLRETVDIITVYEPDPDEWEDDLKTRRKL